MRRATDSGRLREIFIAGNVLDSAGAASTADIAVGRSSAPGDEQT
jgi:hypothetical protein